MAYQPVDPDDETRTAPDAGPSFGDILSEYEQGRQKPREEGVEGRDGIIVALGNEGDADLIESSDHFIPAPPTNEYLLSILEAIPLQLLAYHCAVRRGCDIDQPRNLAKSVTVE